VDEGFDCVFLGNSGIQVSALGIGTAAWGDRVSWGYGQNYSRDDLQDAYKTSRLSQINLFDTAEVYALGHSERLLGQFIQDTGEAAVVATKFMPYPWRLWKSSLNRAIRSSLKRLGMDQVDLYQIHWPIPLRSVETWADALADAIEQGLTRAVGVSNYNTDQMRRTHAVLVKRGVLLASNQIEYNLLNRDAETSGLLGMCSELGITLIAYSPLSQGILSGKYTPEKPPAGMRSRRYGPKLLDQIQPLIRQLREIGRAHDGKTPAQVALNWLICKGAVPIPGAKNARQAHENAGAMGWRLTQEEIDLLDQTSQKIRSS
jgi:aryl-alcohol dehydrogenase-like predicted oxidoreductase